LAGSVTGVSLSVMGAGLVLWSAIDAPRSEAFGKREIFLVIIGGLLWAKTLRVFRNP